MLLTATAPPDYLEKNIFSGSFTKVTFSRALYQRLKS